MPTDGAFACAATTGRCGVGAPAGGEPCGAAEGGPDPGKPDPGGGPLLVATAGAPAVVPNALASASVMEEGRGGAGDGMPCGLEAISFSLNSHKAWVPYWRICLGANRGCSPRMASSSDSHIRRAKPAVAPVAIPAAAEQARAHARSTLREPKACARLASAR